METNYLREYKGYTVKEHISDQDGRQLIICIGEAVNKCFNVIETGPNTLNKAIEQAKEWIDKNPIEETPRYSDEELREFRVIIDNKLEAAEKELLYLSSKIGESDGVEKEQMEQMGKRQETYIGKLKEALQRIENKTYGVCSVTHKLIDKGRLRAVPHATLSIEAKKTTMQTVANPIPVEKPKSKKKKAEKKIVDENIQRCRVCGCTEDNCKQCIEKTGSPCYWVEEDLCSACALKPEEKSQPISTLLNNSDMNFFQQLAADGKVDLSLRIYSKDGKLTVNIIPGTGNDKILPIIVTGTPEELDAEFFTTITQQVKEVTGIVSNIDQVKKHAEKLVDDEKKKVEAKKSESKPVDKKEENKKSPVKKSTSKNKVKNKVDKKKDKKKSAKPVDKKEEMATPEPSLFDAPVAEEETATA